jgi:TolB-like protein/class 3 adenylate cyclase
LAGSGNRSDRSERRLAAIMFTDIVGYTALMAESEAKGLRARERHRALVRPLVERYHGEAIEARGDESLSVFPTALDAVNCALAIEAAVEREPDLKLHLGIHLGDLVVQNGEVSGDGVNIASRICALTEGGGLCVSGEVYRSIRNQPSLEATSLGEQTLRNVPEPVAVYAVRGAAEPPRPVAVPEVHRPMPSLRVAWPILAIAAVAVGWFLIRPGAQPDPIRSIAVLPLENLSGDPEQEYFADGMTEALIGDLAKLSALSVISRTSVMRYKGTDKPLPEIARELDVDAVVEGTVMRAGDRVRITAQLIDAHSDRHIWNDRYDRELSDVLALQSEVARAVAEEIRLELSPSEVAALSSSRRVDPAAYDEYLRGLDAISRVKRDHETSVPAFERAVERAPEFAEAWAGLAAARYFRGQRFLLGRNRANPYPEARAAALRALELDDGLGWPQATLALISCARWDFPECGRQSARAVELSPGDTWVLGARAGYLMFVGRFEEAISTSSRALRVAPLDPSVRNTYAITLFYARRYEEALMEFERLLELDPERPDFHMHQVYWMLGRTHDYHEAWLAFFGGYPPFAPLVDARRRGWEEGGLEGSIRAYLELAEPAAREGRFSPVAVASAYADLGEKDVAFDWLEQAMRERDYAMVGLLAWPKWDPLRDDPRYQDLLRRVGFPES